MLSLKNLTHFSLLKALSKPDKLLKKAKELGYTAVGISDTNLSGVVQFIAAAKREGIKSVIGRKFTYYTLYAKSLTGYKNLLQLDIKSQFNQLDDDVLGQHPDGLICVVDNILPKILGDEVDLEADSVSYLNLLKSIYGNDLYLGLCQNQSFSNDFLRKLGKLTDIGCVAAPESYYVNPEDKEDHKILLGIAYGKTLPHLKDETEVQQFINYDNYYLHGPSDLKDNYSPLECSNLQEILAQIGDYDIFRKPSLPEFPNLTISPEEALRQHCRDGWAKKIKPKLSSLHKDTYINRIKSELDVINSTGLLANYFLITRDYIAAAKARGEIVGVGRGSSGGCLVSYLTNITDIDPIEYDLIFERFYNAGRNADGNVELPDIDTDFEKDHRQDTIDYITAKYGHDRVAHIVTFGNLKGRQALKDVLRITGAMSNDEINGITKYIPDEASIADELQGMGDEASILRWSLINNEKELGEYARYADGVLVGPLAPYFEQAIRLEDTKRNQSSHASGIVISDVPILDICPMLKDTKSDEMVVGLEMDDMKKLGLVKFDILGITALSKFRMVQELVNV